MNIELLANEIEQGFMQNGGHEACVHLLNKVYKEGIRQGVRDYARLEHGVKIVGSYGKTLEQALKEI